MMNCANPYVTATGQAYGCGACMPCRFNRRRIWATRIMVEAKQYSDNCFLTCTYNEENEPKDGSLDPREMQLFIKRLREVMDRTHSRKFRFFGVGEYGDKNGHPHFHYALFNFPTCLNKRTRYNKRGMQCCSICELVAKTWGKGFVYLGEVENDSAGYICGYVTKKMTSSYDPRLNGRHPEFARMSLKPGIGAYAMFDVADTLLNYQNTLDTMSDVPNQLTVGRSNVPLGRYLRRKLREYVGRDGKIPQAEMDKLAEKMLPVRLAARASSSEPSVKKRLIAESSGARAKAAYRRQVFSKGRSL